MITLRLFLFAQILSTGVAMLRADQDIHCIGPDAATGSSKVVTFSNRPLVYTDQLLPRAEGAPTSQVRDLLGQLRTLRGGYGDEPPVRLEWCAASADVIPEILSAMAREFSGPHKPAVTFAVGKLSRPSAAAALNAVATVSVFGKAVDFPFVTTVPTSTGAGRISHGKIAKLPSGGTTYISGQMEQGTTTKESATQTIGSLLKTLDFLKLRKSDAVQFKVFLQPISEAGDVIAAFGEAFGGEAAVPPVVFVEWLGKPSLEIEMVAASPANPNADSLEFLTPPDMKASPVFCRVVRANSTARIFFSSIASSQPGDGAAQTEDVFAQLGSLLKLASSDLDHLAKATYFVSDDTASKALNELRPRYYNPLRPPAASKALVTGIGFASRMLSLDMIAVPK